jgi:hypothetical protein
VRWKREQNLANRRDGMGRGLYAQYAASVVHWRVLHRLLGPEVVPEDTVPKEDARIRRAGRDVRARMDRKAAYRQEKLEELARELTEEAWQDVLDFWEALPKDQKAQYGATKAERAEWRMRQVPRYYRRRVKKEQNWGNYPGLSTDAYQARLLEQGPHALRAMSACRAMFES